MWSLSGQPFPVISIHYRRLNHKVFVTGSSFCHIWKKKVLEEIIEIIIEEKQIVILTCILHNTCNKYIYKVFYILIYKYYVLYIYI